MIVVALTHAALKIAACLPACKDVCLLCLDMLLQIDVLGSAGGRSLWAPTDVCIRWRRLLGGWVDGVQLPSWVLHM
jgi:hypothetical protein